MPRVIRQAKHTQDDNGLSLGDLTSFISAAPSLPPTLGKRQPPCASPAVLVHLSLTRSLELRWREEAVLRDHDWEASHPYRIFQAHLPRHWPSLRIIITTNKIQVQLLKPDKTYSRTEN
ncbi:hypothetical protein N7G274_003433 [Stereocaulon virgatum]|uniref:Uncharacterized protein n=1 Tax=Stereocaulon virgatum TaxID=373712 RepID=A0ABR4AKF7_9LECA